MYNIAYIFAFSLILFFATKLSAETAEAVAFGPLHNALGLPLGLNLGGTHRVRYETLDSQFRAGRNGGDQILVLRTTLKATLYRGDTAITGEMIDARAAFDDVGTPLSTGVVNTAELLQGFLRWKNVGFLGLGGKSTVTIGRFTMDIGSRRFVARNRFRNSANAYTGIDWQWWGRGKRRVRIFFTLPVNRKPNLFGALRDNEIEFDDEDSGIKFWGLYYADTFNWGDNGEFFYFGIDENDSTDRQSLDRTLSTVGFRIYRKPRLSALDYQFESVFQFGESRSSTSSVDVTDLEHFAIFQHVALGYTFALPWHPRLVAQYDYAGGDGRANDRENGRFDTLFGARRFDFGPTGIYGPFARSNINTPGFRLVLKPGPSVSSFIVYRAFWLASKFDSWTASGLRDVSGRSGSFIGQQVELRVRWEVVPNRIRLEGGAAHLFAGEFMRDAPNSNCQGSATYLYSQIGFTF